MSRRLPLIEGVRSPAPGFKQKEAKEPLEREESQADAKFRGKLPAFLTSLSCTC